VEAGYEVEAAKTRILAATSGRNLKQSDATEFWTQDDGAEEINGELAGRTAQLMAELEVAEQKLAKEEAEADAALALAKEASAAEEAATAAAATERAEAEEAKLLAMQEQAEAVAAKKVAERELAEYYDARANAARERAEAEAAREHRAMTREGADFAAQAARKERAEAEAARRAAELKKQKAAEALFLRKHAKAASPEVAVLGAVKFKKLNVVEMDPAVPIGAYAEKRRAATERARRLKVKLETLEHSFVRLPPITPRTPRVVSTTTSHPQDYGGPSFNGSLKPQLPRKVPRNRFSARLPALAGAAGGPRAGPSPMRPPGPRKPPAPARVGRRRPRIGVRVTAAGLCEHALKAGS
jgi:hypothetical protein